MRWSKKNKKTQEEKIESRNENGGDLREGKILFQNDVNQILEKTSFSFSI